MGRSEIMNKKGFLLLILSIIFLGVLFYNFVSDYSSLTTDSGFDVGYSGDSGGGYSGGYDGDSGSGFHSHGSSKTYIKGDDLYVISLIIIFAGAFYLAGNIFSKNLKHRKLRMISRVIFYLSLCCGPLIYSFYIMAIDDIRGLELLWCIVMIFSIIIVTIILKKAGNYLSTKRMFSKMTSEEKKCFDDCYQVFCDVQMAWMNFDYDKLRDLVTDELFNQYQNQLKQLELKKEKNIMRDFTLAGGSIYFFPSNNIEEIEILLLVNFYDYIVDSKNMIVRGNYYKKVHMAYDLTFVRSLKAPTNCPNCNAKLTDGAAICPNCKSHIHSVRGKLKLSHKEVI